MPSSDTPPTWDGSTGALAHRYQPILSIAKETLECARHGSQNSGNVPKMSRSFRNLGRNIPGNRKSGILQLRFLEILAVLGYRTIATLVTAILACRLIHKLNSVPF
jgi:hypothetical protein